MTATYGPLVRLWGIHPSQLPSDGAGLEEVNTFLASLLTEALPFIDCLPPVSTITSSSSSPSPWQHKDIKTFPNSISPVHLYRRTVPAADLQSVAKEAKLPGIDASHAHAETWALRRSVHEDKPVKGTASWDEFVQCFKTEHAESEKAFTPNIVSTRLEQQWDCAGIEIEYDGTTWTNWTLKREGSVHRLPSPLKKRLFPVVQATAAAKGRRDFLVVQIAVRAAEGEEEKGDVLRGAYTSVERVREVDGELEWVMGTVSDAKGVLPGWMQKMAVPGAIAKDVDMFLGWIDGERGKTAGRDGDGAAGDEAVEGQVANGK